MKVKLTKLTALLLAGAAMLASGCTYDYGADIQKNKENIDKLAAEKANVTDVNNQIDALKALLETNYETIASHEKDIQSLNKAITDLETALKLDYQQKIQEVLDLLEKKLDKTTFEAAKKQIEDAIADVSARVKAIEDADFQKQLDDLLTAVNNALATINNRLIDLQNNMADKEQVEKDIAAAKQELLDKIQNVLDVLDKKLDKTTFEAAKKQIEDAIADVSARVKAIEDADFQKQLDDLLTAVNNALATINNRLTNVENAVKTINEETIPAIQNQLDQITNSEGTGRLDVLENTVSALVSSVQSIVLVPAYDDGKMSLAASGSEVNTFKVMPADAAKAVVEAYAKDPDAFSFDVKTVATRTSGDKVALKLSVKAIKLNAENVDKGWVDVSVSSNYSELTSAEKALAYFAALVVNVSESGVGISSPFYGIFVAM